MTQHTDDTEQQHDAPEQPVRLSSEDAVEAGALDESGDDDAERERPAGE